MKNTIIFFLIIFSSGSASSQPAATISNHISFGTYYSIYMVDSNFTPGASGENQVWNFQSIVPKTPFFFDTVCVTNSSGTYYSNLFPTATHAVHSFSFEQLNSSYDYYNVTGSQVEWLGYVDSVYGIKLACSNNLTELSVPLDFDSTEIDFYRYERIPPTYSISGTVNIAYDGFGSLHLPNTSVIGNAYRIKSDRIAIDSNATSIDTFNIITYTWYDPTKNFPILIFKQSLIHGSENGRWLYYNTLSPLNDVNELANENFSFEVIPNPVTNQAVLFFPAPFNGMVSIFNQIGKEMLNEKLTQEINYPINTSLLPCGLYLVQVTNGTTRTALKILKPE